MAAVARPRRVPDHRWTGRDRDDLADYLARRVRSRLVLLGRSAPQPYHRQKLAELERLGAEVLVLQADASDAAQLRAP